MNKGLFIKALKTVWAIYTVFGVLMVIAAIVLPPDAILKNTPTCYSIKQYGRECFMCGSTRSFIQAGHGNFSGAMHLNRFAIALFVLIIINLFIFTHYQITTKLITNKKESEL